MQPQSYRYDTIYKQNDRNSDKTRSNTDKDGSILENYTSNNTRQHDTTWVQHETTQDNT